MAIVTTDDKYYKEIADVIRLNAQGDEVYKPSEMAAGVEHACWNMEINGYNAGISEGYEYGWDAGWDEGYAEGESYGYGVGYDEGHAAGVMDGYERGVGDGKEQGKIELLQASKYMNATASGAIVACDSVSTEFDASVQLSSDTLTDFSGVNVSRYGKNLFKLQDFKATTSTSTIEVKDGILTITYTQGVSTGTPISATNFKPNYIGLPQYPAGTYTFLAEYSYNSGYSVGSYPYLEIKLADGTTSRLEVNTPTEITQPFTANALKFVSNVSKNAGDVYTTTLQVVCGGVSEYEPFVEPTTHTANADGTVDGVRSVSPNMTLVTDTDGVTINCSYLRDIDTYIDSLTMGVSMAAVDGTSGNEVM